LGFREREIVASEKKPRNALTRLAAETDRSVARFATLRRRGRGREGSRAGDVRSRRSFGRCARARDEATPPDRASRVASLPRLDACPAAVHAPWLRFVWTFSRSGEVRATSETRRRVCSTGAVLPEGCDTKRDGPRWELASRCASARRSVRVPPGATAFAPAKSHPAALEFRYQQP
jgi:hypothetical protein